MKIRSITYFCNPSYPFEQKKLRAAGAFLEEAAAAFSAEGYEIQTRRLATPPFPHLLGRERIAQTAKMADELSRLLPEIEIDYAALGPALPDIMESYEVIPEAVAGCKDIFFAGIMADKKRGISLKAVRACGQVILRNATIDPRGFANLNFAALANVPPGVPFFPAAYHEGNDPAFSLAMETADAAVQAFEGAGTVEDGREALVEILERNAAVMTKVADFLKFKHLVRFGGVDFSLAPFPEKSRSLGTAMEALGVPEAGRHGSLAAAAILTEAIERANFPRAGFSGFMPPVLEDSTLAQRAAEGTLTVKDLLLYSAVCGTGLDTVPLPGDVTVGQLQALLLDISSLALRLDKPLTARLMPIPGKKAGEATDFEFGYFANSRVMALEAQGLRNALAGQETFTLNRYNG